MQLDAHAYGNRLRMLPPAHKTAFAMGVLSIAFLSHAPVQLLIFGWMSIWIVVHAGISARFYARIMAVAFTFIILSLPALLIEIADVQKGAGMDGVAGLSAGHWYIYISQSGLQKAGGLAARALAATSCLYFLMLTTPFSEVLHVLRRLHVPAVMLEVMLVMYRFIFVLLETAAQIRIAQLSRGGHRGFWNTMRDMGRLFVQVFAGAMERQRKLIIGLTARGFTGEIRVYQPKRYTPSKRYIAEAVAGMIMLIGMEWLSGGRW